MAGLIHTDHSSVVVRSAKMAAIAATTERDRLGSNVDAVKKKVITFSKNVGEIERPWAGRILELSLSSSASRFRTAREVFRGICVAVDIHIISDFYNQLASNRDIYLSRSATEIASAEQSYQILKATKGNDEVAETRIAFHRDVVTTAVESASTFVKRAELIQAAIEAIVESAASRVSAIEVLFDSRDEIMESTSECGITTLSIDDAIAMRARILKAAADAILVASRNVDASVVERAARRATKTTVYSRLNRRFAIKADNGTLTNAEHIIDKAASVIAPPPTSSLEDTLSSCGDEDTPSSEEEDKGSSSRTTTALSQGRTTLSPSRGAVLAHLRREKRKVKDAEKNKAAREAENAVRGNSLFGGGSGAGGGSSALSSSDDASSTIADQLLERAGGASMADFINVRHKSVAATIDALRADNRKESSSYASSRIRVDGAIAAIWFSGDIRSQCHPEIVMAYDSVYPYLCESAKAEIDSSSVLAGGVDAATGGSGVKPIFDPNADSSKWLSLFAGISSSGVTASRATGMNTVACADRASAAVIESFMSRAFYADSDDPFVLMSLMLPMVSTERFRIGSAAWYDTGRAFATTFRSRAELSFTGFDQWCCATARKLIIERAKKWADAPIKTKEREVIRDYFRIDGRGAKRIRGEEVTHSMNHDPLDSIYTKTVGSMPRTEDTFSALVADPFESQFMAMFYLLIAAILKKSERDELLPSVEDGGIALTAEAYCRFRGEYKDTMRGIYIEVQKGLVERKTSVADTVRRIVTTVTGNGASASDFPSFQRPPKREGNEDDEVNAEIARTVEQDTRIAEIANGHVAANKAISAFRSPEDFEWSSVHEVNCALMFIHFTKTKALVRRFEQDRKHARNRIFEHRPTLANILKPESLATPEGVGRLIVALSGIPNQSDANIIVWEAMRAIAINEVRPRAQPAWHLFESETPRVSVRTMGFFASHDSPTEYSTFHDHRVISSLHKAVESKALRLKYIGEFASRMLWQSYICEATTTPSGSTTAHWYKLEPGAHHLTPVAGTSQLYSDIQEGVGEYMGQMLRFWRDTSRVFERKVSTLTASEEAGEGRGGGAALKQINDKKVENVAGWAKKLLPEIEDVRRSVENDKSRSAIISYMRTNPLLVCRDFRKLENTADSLLVFTNGVIDMGGDDSDENIICFREGKVEDFMTKCTWIHMPYGGRISPLGEAFDSYASRERFSFDCPEIKKALEYLSQVFPDPDLLEYAILDIASFLHGGNNEKQFRMWSGRSNNSKSIIIKILQTMFGDYAFDLPAEIVCTSQHRNSSGPSPELAQSPGTRIGVMTEPSSKMEMDMGIIKRFTSGDRQFMRTLHDKGRSEKISWRILMQCNDPPKLMGLDDAAKKRVILLPFLSTWRKYKKGEEPAIEDQRKNREYVLDENFDKNVPSLARAFAWIMFHRYPEARRRKTEDVPRPQVVEEHLKEYFERVDIFANFQAEAIVPNTAPPGTAQPLTVSELFQVFNAWAAAQQSEGSRRMQLSKRDFEMHMTRPTRLGALDITSKSLRGWYRYSVSEELYNKL
jgi:phage/plasmid-associated DNA primase